MTRRMSKKKMPIQTSSHSQKYSETRCETATGIAMRTATTSGTTRWMKTATMRQI
jgi:hypothetical protein